MSNLSPILNTNIPQLPHELTLSRLYQITPLSKYLAMAFFIVLPFLGGYIGYYFGIGEETATVIYQPIAMPVDKSDTMTLKKYLETLGSDTLSVTAENRNLFESLKLLPPKSTKIGDVIHLDKVASISDYAVIKYVYENQYQSALLFNLKTNQVARELNYAETTFAYEIYLYADTYAGEEPIAYGIKCAAARNCPPTVYKIDLLSGQTSVLYTEYREGLRLGEACEINCSGLLYELIDGDILVGVYDPIDSITVKFKESIVIKTNTI